MYVTMATEISLIAIALLLLSLLSSVFSQNAVLNFLTAEDCLLYIIAGHKSYRVIGPELTLGSHRKKSSSLRSMNLETRNLFELEKFFTLLPIVHERFHPVVMDRSHCDCCPQSSAEEDESLADAPLFQAYSGRCVNFILFEDSPLKIEQLLAQHKWLPSRRTSFMIMADLFDLPVDLQGWWETEHPLRVLTSGKDGFQWIKKFSETLSRFQRCQAPVLVSLHRDHSGLNTNVSVLNWGDNFYGHVHFGLLCPFCPLEERIHLLDHNNQLTAESIQEHHFVLNKNDGHGAAALLDESYRLRSKVNFRECEEAQYFQIEHGEKTCTYNGIILGLLSKHFNFSIRLGKFVESKGENVLELCLSLCYTHERYTSTEPVRVFVTETESTRLLYCRKTVEIERPEWKVLWTSFDDYVWIGILVSPLVLALVGRREKIGFEFLSLMLTQPLGRIYDWGRRRNFGLGICFLMPLIIGMWYQGDATSELIVPLRQRQIKTVRELFIRQGYKVVMPSLPDEKDQKQLIEFRRIGIFSNLSRYLRKDETLQGTSPASGYERGRLVGKYCGSGAVMIDRTQADYAQAVSRRIWRNMTCSYVKEKWMGYWNTWIIKSHLSDMVHLRKYRLMQAGIVRFWVNLFRAERYRFIRVAADRFSQIVSYRPISLKSPIYLILVLFWILMGVATLCFLVEVTYDWIVRRIKLTYYNLRMFAR